MSENQRFFQTTLVDPNKNYNKSEDEFDSSGISTFEDLMKDPNEEKE